MDRAPALAAAYVLLTAGIGPVLAKASDGLAARWARARGHPGVAGAP